MYVILKIIQLNTNSAYKIIKKLLGEIKSQGELTL